MVDGGKGGWWRKLDLGRNCAFAPIFGAHVQHSFKYAVNRLIIGNLKYRMGNV